MRAGAVRPRRRKQRRQIEQLLRRKPKIELVQSCTVMRSHAGPTGEEQEDTFDALGNKIAATKKKAKLSSAELRKKKKDRMARRKRGEEVFSDEDDM